MIKVKEIEMLNRCQPDGGLNKPIITETALRQVVGKRNIDDVLTTQKAEVQDEVLRLMASATLTADYSTGIGIIAVGQFLM